jgi:hypothetical protein
MDVVHCLHGFQAEIHHLFWGSILLPLLSLLLVFPVPADVVQVILSLLHNDHIPINLVLLLVEFNDFLEDLGDVVLVSNQFQKVTLHE